jgi:hypothetical protein
LVGTETGSIDSSFGELGESGGGASIGPSLPGRGGVGVLPSGFGLLSFFGSLPAERSAPEFFVAELPQPTEIETAERIRRSELHREGMAGL